ncbi:hypothetical protein ACPXB3_00470 [Gordonia sp. DT219]|uniref:hypothetical protein n=1 Tax=Gordonia sp. DT219 TaxID=3416658 RepID=UPI003CFB826F
MSELAALDAYLQYTNERTFAIEVGVPRGRVRLDPDFARGAVHADVLASALKGVSFRADQFTRKHIWVTSMFGDRTELIARRYSTPTSVAMPPPEDEQRRVLAPLGVTKFHKFSPIDDSPKGALQRAIWRYRLAVAMGIGDLRQPAAQLLGAVRAAVPKVGTAEVAVMTVAQGVDLQTIVNQAGMSL